MRRRLHAAHVRLLGAAHAGAEPRRGAGADFDSGGSGYLRQHVIAFGIRIAEAVEQCVGFGADAQRFAVGRERDAQRQQQWLRRRWEEEVVSVPAAVGCELTQLRQLVEAEVVPQEGVRRMQRNGVLLRKRERRGEVRLAFGRFAAGSA
uniref:Uncharacterized protein n=1 Tax=uncultured marine group II/III euryarchaeote SAT1000_17_E06 TaxID=1456561 RepID=A0A075I6S7_9EURY|nr:hypothetical protein [uncultured marine group II/III euryarchaeote SAT1000_17_E06]